ncbi:hypothetical protein [Acinetobacter phage vB_ApiM_IME-Ap7]|uniref:Uncharacterized protein DUF551 n=1 Tax=Thermovibrio guaymasensis TaxID=240167 RepID=A0A420W5D9_9BACT|nr:DUF551 domain-containing protein [Thermovibrio guaymasensis]RKQ59896.1 uncharacterized protein DUF551 [Thermovibrio guaymasensis]
MTDLNKLRSEFEAYEHSKKPCAIKASLFEVFTKDSLDEDEYSYIGRYVDSFMQEKWELWQKAKAQAVPTWISAKDEEPPTDTMVLICWSDSPDVQPEIDYMTCDEDLNHIWANFEIEPPTHWMYFHKVPSESGAEQ